MSSSNAEAVLGHVLVSDYADLTRRGCEGEGRNHPAFIHLIMHIAHADTTSLELAREQWFDVPREKRVWFVKYLNELEERGGLSDVMIERKRDFLSQ